MHPFHFGINLNFIDFCHIISRSSIVTTRWRHCLSVVTSALCPWVGEQSMPGGRSVSGASKSRQRTIQLSLPSRMVTSCLKTLRPPHLYAPTSTSFHHHASVCWEYVYIRRMAQQLMTSHSAIGRNYTVMRFLRRKPFRTMQTVTRPSLANQISATNNQITLLPPPRPAVVLAATRCADWLPGLAGH